MITHEPVIIDINEWSLKGEGLFGSVYESDRYPSVILKLNKNTDREGPWEEYDKSRRIVAMDVKTPRVYDYVTDGKRFGYTAQKIEGKAQEFLSDGSIAALLVRFARYVIVGFVDFGVYPMLFKHEKVNLAQR